jgi:thiosulfate/3-mercaptopyruvate sulfurtransferase
MLATDRQPLVEPAWLEPRLHQPDVRVVEVDVSRTAYDAEHIPGASLWNVYADLLQPNYRVVDREACRALLERTGITPDTTVVFYGYAASLAFWMLQHYGHRRVAFLNGARSAWLAEGRPTTGEPPSVAPSQYPIEALDAVQPAIRADQRQVEAAIGDRRRRLMDVRSVAEYTGERFWPTLPPEGDQRGGHVPGARLVPIEQTWSTDGRFKPAAELRAYYQANGFTPDTEIITYCAVGGRASQAWFVLTYLLDFPNVRVYDASWIEWGSLPGLPVER